MLKWFEVERACKKVPDLAWEWHIAKKYLR
jgi:hypothetical protein